MYQCVLQRLGDNAIIIVWLSNEKEFKKGDYITLKTSDNPTEKWKVVVKDDKPQPFKDVKQTWTSQDIKRDGSRKKLDIN